MEVLLKKVPSARNKELCSCNNIHFQLDWAVQGTTVQSNVANIATIVATIKMQLLHRMFH